MRIAEVLRHATSNITALSRARTAGYMYLNLMGCLQDPANVQQTSSKCIQNTRANAGRLLDRVNTL